VALWRAETPFEAQDYVDFRVTKFNLNSSNDISKKKSYSKFWPHVIRGPLSSRGPYTRAYRA